MRLKYVPNFVSMGGIIDGPSHKITRHHLATHLPSPPTWMHQHSDGHGQVVACCLRSRSEGRTGQRYGVPLLARLPSGGRLPPSRPVTDALVLVGTLPRPQTCYHASIGIFALCKGENQKAGSMEPPDSSSILPSQALTQMVCTPDRHQYSEDGWGSP